MFKIVEKKQKTHHTLPPNKTTGLPGFTSEEVVDLLETTKAVNERLIAEGKDINKADKWLEVISIMKSKGHPERPVDNIRQKFYYYNNKENELEQTGQRSYSLEELFRIKQLKESPTEEDKIELNKTKGDIYKQIVAITNREFNVVRISVNIKAYYNKYLNKKSKIEIENWFKSKQKNYFKEEDINTMIYIDQNFKKEKNQGETDWEAAKDIFPNLDSIQVGDTYRYLKHRGHIDANKSLPANFKPVRNETLVPLTTRRIDANLKGNLLRMIDDENIYYTDVAQELSIDVDVLEREYNNLTIARRSKCGFLNCIRAFKNDQDRETHIEAHKSSKKLDQQVQSMASTKITNEFIKEVDNEINKLNKIYPKEAKRFFMVYYIFDDNIESLSEDDLIIKLLNGHGYVGQTYSFYRKNEHVINCLFEEMFENLSFKGELIFKMQKPTFSVLFGNLSEGTSCVLEKYGINSGLRSLMNVYKSSPKIANYKSNENTDRILTTGVITQIVSNYMHKKNLYEINISKISKIINYMISPFKESISQFYFNTNKYSFSRFSSAIEANLIDFPFKDCEKCSFTYLNNYKYCPNCANPNLIQELEEDLITLD